MVPDESTVRRRAVLAAAGAGLSGLAGCGYLGDTTADQPPLVGESIRVGVLAASNLPHGEAIEHGARMAAERINADGGVAGAGLDLVLADTEVDPDTARDEHRRLCEAEDCDLTVGLFLGSAVLETLESVAEQETVHPIVEAGDPELPPQDDIVEALEGVTFTDGRLYDEFAFTGLDADLVHEPAWGSMEGAGVPVVQQWRADGDGGGERVAIAPADSRSAAYRRPPWLA